VDYEFILNIMLRILVSTVCVCY